MKLEQRMLCILRRNAIPVAHVSGKYKSALTHLVQKELCVVCKSTFKLAIKAQVSDLYTVTCKSSNRTICKEN
jgi:hypothetical protein